MALEPIPDEVRSDESGAAGDQQTHPGHYLQMTALVIGASGLVGGALCRTLGHIAVGTYHTRPIPGLIQLDAYDKPALRRILDDVDPSIVFFPAAEPNVDWCELHPDDAYAANVVPAVSALALSLSRRAMFVFFSSDYVFD